MIRLYLAISLWTLIISMPVMASDVVQVDHAEIYRSDDTDKNIPGLVFDSELGVEREQSGDQTRYLARLKGHFTQPFQRVQYRVENQAMQDLQLTGGAFDFAVVLTSPKLKVQIFVEKDERTHFFEVIYVRSSLDELLNHFFFGFGVSYQVVDYDKTYINQVKLTELAAVPQLNVTYRFAKRFEMNANGMITLVPIGFNKDPADTGSSRFYDLSTRLGFRLWEFSKTASVHLFGGWHRWGELVSDGISPAITGLGGPQVALMARFKTNSGHHWYTYVKWAALNGETSSPDNREFSGGFGYQISSPYQARHWMLNIDLSMAKYDGMKGADAQSFSLNSFGIGVSTQL
jgi:hypothetical protein